MGQPGKSGSMEYGWKLNKMIDFKHLQGNLIVSASGIGISFLGKRFFHKEFIPVSNLKQTFTSFGFLMVITILGKKTMDEMAKFNWITFTTRGKDKIPNEGFIGPLKDETIGPQKWDFIPK